MVTGQKQAWFHLAVVALTVITVLVLIPALGARGAQGGLGLLGLLGLSPYLFRRRRGAVFYDERDGLILARAWFLGYVVYFVAFVGASMVALYSYGPNGSVPVFLVVISAWYGVILLFGVSSIATLLQYAWGGSRDA
jgi:hypothetical protein